MTNQTTNAISGENVEISIVMPCLNEAETLAACIMKAHEGAKKAGVHRYEIIVADNGSTDGSQAIALKNGAVVTNVPVRGYGAALQSGIKAAQGKYIIMGDSDYSYDFAHIEPFVEKLRQGYQLVMGTRLKGTIKPGAMPILHRYLGNPVLSALGNLFFKAHLSDFHCGLRAFDRQSMLDLNLHTQGMEYASEMVIRAALANFRRCEVPIVYYPDGRSRKPHLNTWGDGWRHLRFMLIFSPRWVLLYPGLVMSVVGGIVSVALLPGPIKIGAIALDVHTLLVSSTILVMGIQLIFLSIFSHAYASRIGLLPIQPYIRRLLNNFPLGLGIFTGLVTIAFGILLYGFGLVLWDRLRFGAITDYTHTLRVIIAGTTCLLIGMQILFSSLIMSLLGIQ
jgi:Glycosyl transferase family 2